MADLTQYQRIAHLCWLLYELRPGERLTISHASRAIAASPDATYRLLLNLSTVLPIYDEHGKGWLRLNEMGF